MSSNARRATPSISAARIIRSRFSPAISCAQASPGVPTTAASGTKQSVKYRSLTSRPPIVSMPLTSRPSASVSTMNWVSPRCLDSSRDVRAMSRM
ncbi:hypothetical protein AMK26_19470 [Streptomyces sp. CB03234]|nr:hypothetical protein AMK26_19470 [Streptomyces sp. CB03234]